MRANLAGLKCVCDEIARAIKSAESSAIFLLVGDIGAGKTTLVREFAEYVGIKESVTSPTFSLLHIYSAGNSVLGMQFRTCENFRTSTDFSLVESPKISTNTKATPQSLPLRFCESQNLGENHAQNAESSADSALTQNLGKNSGKVAESSVDSAKSQNLTLFPTIYHYDLFNRNLGELLDLGLLDLLEQRGIHFVEWGDRRLFEIIKDAFENIFILQITKAKNDRIYELKREF